LVAEYLKASAEVVAEMVVIVVLAVAGDVSFQDAATAAVVVNAVFEAGSVMYSVVDLRSLEERTRLAA
jgi:hypothetical protein